MNIYSAADLSTALGLHPIVAQVLWVRGCHSPEAARAFLDPNFHTPAPASDLPDMDRAVARLRVAIAKGERIRIWGDFDVDGQTSTSVLLIGLRELGAVVDFNIPDRITHSHGLNAEGVAQAAADGVAILLTCDCGIAEFDEIAQARALGVDVIVSDHHDLHFTDDGTPRLPDALAVINPKRLPADHALSQLPGVGVAYKLVEALNDALVDAKQTETLLDLVALGIVADVAIQRGDTRYLLQRGLSRLRLAERPGIRALMKISDINPQQFDADSIGYQIAPRLNAAGRLSTAALAVDLLTTQDAEHAHALAAQIDALNLARRDQQKRIEAEALALIAADPAIAERPVIVLHHPDWSASVIGIVASTLVDRYQRPAILIAEQAEGSGRASARSLAGIDIHAAIAAQGQFIEGGGGHPMAAGFAIQQANIAPFIASINAWVGAANVRRAVTTDTAAAEPHPDDFRVAWREAELPLAEQLAQLAPFGAGNPYPILRSDSLQLVRYEPLGKREDTKHRAVYLTDGRGAIFRALWWRSANIALPLPGQPLSVRYKLRREVFRGTARAVIEIVSLTNDEPERLATSAQAQTVHTAHYSLIDLRASSDVEHARQQLITATGVDNSYTWHSYPPKPCQMLLLQDVPAGPEEFKRLLLLCNPQTVVLLPGADADHAAEIETRVRSMLKTAQGRNDSLDDPAIIEKMAMRINQRMALIRALIARDRGQVGAEATVAFELAETIGYRRFMRSAPSDKVLPG